MTRIVIPDWLLRGWWRASKFTVAVLTWLFIAVNWAEWLAPHVPLLGPGLILGVECFLTLEILRLRPRVEVTADGLVIETREEYVDDDDPPSTSGG